MPSVRVGFLILFPCLWFLFLDTQIRVDEITLGVHAFWIPYTSRLILGEKDPKKRSSHRRGRELLKSKYSTLSMTIKSKQRKKVEIVASLLYKCLTLTLTLTPILCSPKGSQKGNRLRKNMNSPSKRPLYRILGTKSNHATPQRRRRSLYDLTINQPRSFITIHSPSQIVHHSKV